MGLSLSVDEATLPRQTLLDILLSVSPSPGCCVCLLVLPCVLLRSLVCSLVVISASSFMSSQGCLSACLVQILLLESYSIMFLKLFILVSVFLTAP